MADIPCGAMRVQGMAEPYGDPVRVNIVGGSSGGGSTGGLTDEELRASPIEITGNVIADVGTVPVTGTFYPPTQPISGNVGITGSVAVTGIFYPATQPVSIAASVAVTGPVTDTQLRATPLPVSGTVTASGPLTDTQLRASAVPTKDSKDTARTQFSAATVIGGVTAVTSEALLTMVPVRAGVASGTVTTQTVTSGKTLRLTAISVGIKSTSAAVLAGVFALRMNPNGAVTASSPILALLPVTQKAAALAQAGAELVLPLPDGIEFSGTQQFGLTQVCSATTGVVYASLIGFEY